MSWLMRRFGVALLVFATVASLLNSLAWADDPSGKNLFTERWAVHDKRSTKGDGLGPMHNATSCAACHHQAGVGGGGGRRHNVDLLSVVPVKQELPKSQDFKRRLIRLHPGFATGKADEVRPNLVLHRFGPEADYFDFRARLLGIEEPRPDVDPARRAVLATALAKRRQKQAAPVETLAPVDGISFKLSQRNTPALWGAGLVDSIPDAVIREFAEGQKLERPEIAGRAPNATGGGVGRFGWRGQTASLRQFVLIACANELGLQTEGHPQPVNPLTSDYRPRGADLNEREVDAMVAFVANLPRPIESRPTKSAAETARKGEQTFERIGCADCHPRTLGRINGLFSDLLLHDMGAELEDPVEPNPDIEIVEIAGRRFGGYSGSGTIFVERERPDETLPRQWRTPPLWGVKDSAPYLHDGRADTLVEAITMHGGQGAASASKFRSLRSNEQANLIAFLETLVVKEPEGRLNPHAAMKW